MGSSDRPAGVDGTGRLHDAAVFADRAAGRASSTEPAPPADPPAGRGPAATGAVANHRSHAAGDQSTSGDRPVRVARPGLGAVGALECAARFLPPQTI